MLEWLGSIGSVASGLGALGGAIGGLFGGGGSKGSAADLLGRQMDRQEIWNKHQVQWRVEDAKKAGIHPLYALGAQISTPQVPSVVGDSGSSFSDRLSSAGQDIGRAADALLGGKARMAARLDALALERGELENDLLRSQIARLNAPGHPPGPPDPDDWMNQLGPVNRHYPPSGLVEVHDLPAGTVPPQVQVKPSEVYTTELGRPGSQPSANPEVRWQRNELGGIDRMPGEAWQLDDLSAPGVAGFHFRNTLIPSLPFGQRLLPPPPKQYERPGQTGWLYKIGVGYVPVFTPKSSWDVLNQQYVDLEGR